MIPRLSDALLGEFLGTFILVLFGCGSVAVAVLFGGHQSLFQVAIVWGIGVSLAIYITRHLSGAHLNPAVTVGFATGGMFPFRRVPFYVAAQFAGAFCAAAVLYGLFSPSIEAFEVANGILRGKAESIHTAKMFGQFYPNPGGGAQPVVSQALAFSAEAFGTFLLMLGILFLTDSRNQGSPGKEFTPVLIGLLVTSLICLIAPLTQAGLNPARDLGPRLVAAAAGWGNAAYPRDPGSFLTVYVFAPIFGSVVAMRLYKVLNPFQE
jgi:glycerol uptake facilitator protein